MLSEYFNFIIFFYQHDTTALIFIKGISSVTTFTFPSATYQRYIIIKCYGQLTTAHIL